MVKGGSSHSEIFNLSPELKVITDNSRNITEIIFSRL